MLDVGDGVASLELESAEAWAAFWRGIFDIHLDPLALLDMRYRIVRVNHALADALGRRAEDLIGKRCFEVFHGMSCPIANCPHARLLEDGCAHAEEFAIESLGGIYWISVTPVFNTEGELIGSLHIARNVSHYKALESELRFARDAVMARSEERAREIKQHVRFGQLLVSLALDIGRAKSEEGILSLIQQGVTEIAASGGYDRCVFWILDGKVARAVARGEKKGAPSDPHPEDVTDSVWLLEASARLGVLSQLPDGRTRFVVALMSPQNERCGAAIQVEFSPTAGRPVERMEAPPQRLRLFCQVFANALWRHADLEELHSLRSELTHLDRVARLGQLTAMLAHELNQPLAATLCNAQAAVRLLGRTPPDLKEIGLALDDIVDNARRAGDVVKRTRELFKSERTAVVQKVNLCVLVERVLSLLHNEIAISEISLTRSFDPSMPLVLGDEVQLQQVVVNLMTNALDAVRGKPRNERKILIGIQPDFSSRMGVLSVRDTGDGFVPGQETLIFKPFHTTKAEGMGMGLAICKQIVERLGGAIGAERLVKGETEFRVSLPLAMDENNEPHLP